MKLCFESPQNALPIICIAVFKGGSSAGAPGARPLSEIFYWCIFKNFDFITRIINMQCLQYVFYSLLSLQKHRVCVKGHQNLHTSKIKPRRVRAPGSLISESATGFKDKVETC